MTRRGEVEEKASSGNLGRMGRLHLVRSMERAFLRGFLDRAEVRATVYRSMVWVSER